MDVQKKHRSDHVKRARRSDYKERAPLTIHFSLDERERMQDMVRFVRLDQGLRGFEATEAEIVRIAVRRYYDHLLDLFLAGFSQSVPEQHRAAAKELAAELEGKSLCEIYEFAEDVKRRLSATE